MMFRRKKLKSRGSQQGAPVLQITSLLDIMTILLFFLLKHYSASVSINISQNLQLPKSISRVPPVNALQIAVSREEITINGEIIVVQFEDSPVPGVKQIPRSDFNKDPDLIIPLLEELKRQRGFAEDVMRRTDIMRFSGDCIVQADKDTTYAMIHKILYTAGQVGYTMLSFAVLYEE